MKTVNAFVIILFSVLAVACKTNPTNGGKPDNNNDIYGNWLWKSSTGGIGGTTTFPTGNNKYTLQITVDSNFIESRNDTITFNDKFTLYYVDAVPHPILVLDFINSKRFSLAVNVVSSDSLILSDTFIDGYTSVYTRIH